MLQSNDHELTKDYFIGWKLRSGILVDGLRPALPGPPTQQRAGRVKSYKNIGYILDGINSLSKDTSRDFGFQSLTLP